MGKTEIFVGVGIALLAAALNFLFPKFPDLVVIIFAIVGVVLIFLGFFTSLKKNEQNPEIIKIRQDAQRLKELLLSYHGSFKDQKKEIGGLIEGLRNSKSLVWTNDKIDQLRRDFLQSCGIAFFYEKYNYESKEDDIATRADINELWKKLDTKLSKIKIPNPNENSRTGESKGPVAIKISGGRNNTFIGNKYIGSGTFFELGDSEGNEFKENVQINPRDFKRQNTKPDVPLLHAIYFVAFGEWEVDRQNTQNFDAIYNAEARVFKAARHGDLPVWGNSSQKTEYLIPKRFWVENQLELMGALRFNSPLEVRTMRNFENNNAIFYDALMTSKERVEDLWNDA